ncbi:MAG: hypothetical protein ACRDKZ_02865 [Actinomycetota bacterium]
MRKLRRIESRASVLIAAALVTGLIAPVADAAPSMRARLERKTLARTAAPQAAGPCGGLEQVSLETFHVQMKAQADRYAIGDTAKVDVTVHRTLPQNPGNTGIRYDSPYMEPAPDVSVGVGLRVGDSFLYGFGFTDEKGQTTVKIKLRSYADTGMVVLTTFATKNVATTICARVDEVGFAADPRAFRITP